MGYEYGDAQNIAVRCFLNQFSKNFQYFDEYYKNKTLEYFDYKCPYTDVELTLANMVKDHVIPFNKKSCGLHVFGNVLIVDKKANSDKSSKSLEEYLKNYPERLQKIKKFIKVTGYKEIHEKYQQYLCETCNELYDEIGNTIKNQCDCFQVKHLKNTQRKPKTFISKLVTTSKSPQNIRVFSASVNTKSNAIDICAKNGIFVQQTNNYATKNSTQDTYWINPDIDNLNKKWSIILNDNINKIIYYFEIPPYTFNRSQFRMKNNKQIDLKINYGDNKFTDKKSNISFAKWLVKTINY